MAYLPSLNHFLLVFTHTLILTFLPLMATIYDISLTKHAEARGKLTMISKVHLATKQDLATYYSPGVAAPCLAIQKNPELAYVYTWKHNTIACVSDGTAVL